MKTEFNDWEEVAKELNSMSVPANLIGHLYTVSQKFDLDMSDVYSKGQLISKMWLCDRFPFDMLADSPNIYICAGWYGQLAMFLNNELPKDANVLSLDIDDSCKSVAYNFNQYHTYAKFDAWTRDISEMDYSGADVVINTSCEHIEKFDEWAALIADDTLMVLQSNNYVDVDEHVNCVSSEDELLEASGITKVLYKGKLSLPNYDRFMVIGFK